ncbi:non-ribosomal peptide synthetase, partial [Microtetraspora fusca]|uniref:non-ribosomal peptide synthetase n=1 Tax=Microtetraspora fusca TaxID=1997 RepID=UPI000B25EA95
PPGEPYTLAGAAATDEDRIADLFARRAAATPDAVAFITRSRAHDIESDAPRADRTDAEATGELTYGEVDRRARELAARLRAFGAGPESVVGVCLPPGPDLPVALLGILYAGAAYLPLDPALPIERLAYMIEDAGAALVVIDPPGPWAPSGDSTNPSGPAYSAGLPAGTRPVPVRRPSAGITENAPAVHGDIGEAVTLPVAADPDGLAAVIYTSGSTGRPKGVAITGRSLLNRLAWMWRDLPFGPDEVCCQKTAIGFVDSLWELLGPPLAGVPTVVVEPATVRDPLAFVEELASGRVTRLLLVPSLLRVLLRAVPDLDARLPRLTTWISSGEPLSQELSRLFHERMPGRTLVNLYGASEAWDALCPEPDTAPTPVEQADSGDSQPGEGAHGVPVGRPIAGVRACVLDGGLLPVPGGVPGELYVGGRCLARGYLGRPALTAERFLPDPAGSGERLYRTGDLARVRSDGRIELLGRADHQVKIRGMRVEPGEVEAALDEFPEVGQAAVVAARAGDDAVLVAHVVPAEGAAPCVPAELKRALARRLPAHLVPAQVVLRDELPRTATGKIDRRSLADEGLVSGTLAEDPQRDRDGREPFGEAEPVTELERRIAAVWAEALGREVGRYDDFFDVGGHSLLAPVLVAKLSAELSVDLPLSWVFDHPTVYAMSRSPEPARTGDGGPTGPCHAPHDVGEPGRKGCIP